MHRTSLAVLCALYIGLILLARPTELRDATHPIVACAERPDTPSDVPWGG